MSNKIYLSFILCLPGIFGLAQNNYVPNGDFEEVVECDLEYGEIYKAVPWMIVDTDNNTSPDLFHGCSTNPFFDIPVSGVYPYKGMGLAGISGKIGNANAFTTENIYVRLLDRLPTDVDIYVAYSLLPNSIEGAPMSTLCYTNHHVLAFSEPLFLNRVNVLELDYILRETEEWTRVQSCYQATGDEALVLIGDYRLTSETLSDCVMDDPFNSSYTYVDDVVVAPFDVVPDTIVLCEGDEIEFNITFYDVPIRWNDGWEGGGRLITEGGDYVVWGVLDDCYLQDTMTVIKLPDESGSFEVNLCEGEVYRLQTPVTAIWPNGDTAMFYDVSRPGNYTARVLAECGERVWEYEVKASDCSIQYFVPNAFTPNGDGVNDRLQFFFESAFEFNGELSIFDRWGNQLLNVPNVRKSDTVSWDGYFRGALMDPAVFVWTFQYTSEKDGKTRIISGDAALVY